MRFISSFLATLAALSVLLAAAPTKTIPPETLKQGDNLLRNTRLVAGLPNGWVMSDRVVPVFSEGDDFTFQTDKVLTGPSGFPTFKVDILSKNGVPGPYGTEEYLYFYTEPFKVPKNGPYTASVYVRGTGSGIMEIVGDKLVPKSRTSFTLEKDAGWQRISHTFMGSKSERLYGIRFLLKGTVWFDGFQVNAGKTATPYASQFPAEVALAPTSGAADPVRIQFADEPAKLDWTVSGGEEGNILRGRVMDLSGHMADLPAVELKSEPLQSGTWNYARKSLNLLGQFRIEAWIENATGDRQSSLNEIVLTRLRRPHYWGKDAPNSPFGVHAEATSGQILTAKAMGMNWVRLHDAGIQALGWYYVEPKPGEWHFLDDQIDRYRNRHLSILGELGTAPHFRSYAKTATAPPRTVESTKTAAFFAPLNNEEYADYVKRAVEHFGDKISYYDIWNEPWHPSFFSVDYVTTEPETLERATNVGVRGSGWYINSPTAPENYIQLQKAAFDAIEKLSPDTKVVGINTHTHDGKEGRFSGDVWSQRVKSAGGMDALDVVGYHQYMFSSSTGYEGDIIDTDIDRAFKPFGGVEAIKAAGHPVWMTEGSPIARKSYSGFYNHTLPYRQTGDYWDLSDRMVRYLVRLLSEGIDKVFLYSMDGYSYFGQKGRARLLVNEDGYPHPTGAAASTVAWNLEDTDFQEAIPLPDKNGTAYVFKGNGTVTAVLIPAPESKIPVPQLEDQTITIEDIFGNPPESADSAYSIFVRGPSPAMKEFVKTLKPPPTVEE